MAMIGTRGNAYSLGRKVGELALPAFENMRVGDYIYACPIDRQWKKMIKGIEEFRVECPCDAKAGEVITVAILTNGSNV